MCEYACIRGKNFDAFLGTTRRKKQVKPKKKLGTTESAGIVIENAL